MTTKPVKELQFATYNPRKISKHDFQKLVASIKEFGFVEPVVINSDNTIIGGHMRVRAAQELGIHEVPVVVVDLPKSKEKALNLALNRIHGEWDDQLLAELIYEIHELPEIELTGFSTEEISRLLNEFTPVSLNEQPRLDEKNKVVCPECGHEFTP